MIAEKMKQIHHKAVAALRAMRDHLYITEILHDLHKHGFVCGGKAECMLHDWARELREKTRAINPVSRSKKRI